MIALMIFGCRSMIFRVASMAASPKLHQKHSSTFALSAAYAHFPRVFLSLPEILERTGQILFHKVCNRDFGDHIHKLVWGSIHRPLGPERHHNYNMWISVFRWIIHAYFEKCVFAWYSEDHRNFAKFKMTKIKKIGRDWPEVAGMAENGFGTKFIDNLSSFYKRIILINQFSKDLSQKEAG